jgi:hypothetical protein
MISPLKIIVTGVAKTNKTRMSSVENISMIPGRSQVVTMHRYGRFYKI